MKIIDFNTIKALKITPNLCLDWVRNALISKNDVCLPPKISIKLKNNVFFNTMPCYILNKNCFGVKVVTRFPGRMPSLESHMLIYDSINGNLLAILDATWITCMRTGAVAALAVQTFERSNANVYGFIGLGNTARATMLCLKPYLESKKEPVTIKLFAYKGQEYSFIERFQNINNIKFQVETKHESMIRGTDVLISCVTAADMEFGKNEWYEEGILLIPVHTRGFQNCDLFFDKIYADDVAHIHDFKHFKEFKRLSEFSSVITGDVEGRENDNERIISYNIGIALHDIFFASKIFSIVSGDETIPSLPMEIPTEKFWI